MKALTLTLRVAPGRVARATACLLPGCDPIQWLDDLLQLDVSLADLRLLILPRSRADRSASGALAFLPAGEVACRAGTRAQSWYRTGKLFLPIDAVLAPPLRNDEIAALAPFAYGVFHPGLGLIAYDERDVLRIDDLCAPPREHTSAWDRAEPGLAMAAQLREIKPMQSIDLPAFFAGERQDIGATAPQALAPPPQEPAARPLRATLARCVLWLTARLPATASSPTWINRLEKWASEQISRAGSLALDVDRRRQEALTRLLELLQQDPDRGLRHALPLWAPPARGGAPPGTLLPERPTDFAFGALSAASPADPWDVDPVTTKRLQQNYRALAMRELKLGRHRRAAYVFAHLLGDFHAAANALAAGGHYREAAALYRDQLWSPLEAAKCLQRGGLLLEAAELFASEGEHEVAGDIFAQVQQSERAVAAYRDAIAAAVEKADHIAAARIAEQKLLLPDEALALLAEGWSLLHARPCGIERFALLGRLGRHVEAARLVDELASLPPAARVVAADVFATAAGEYPAPPLRARLADATRSVAGGWLPRANPAERAVLLAAVRRLAPDDPLLEFDTRRIGGWFDRAAPRADAERFALPQEFKWRAAAAMPGGFIALGVGRDGRECALYSCEWGQSGKPRPLRLPPLLRQRGPVRSASIAVCGDQALLVLHGATTAAFLVDRHEHPVVRPLPVPPGLLAATIDVAGVRWLVSRDGDEGSLRALDAHGTLLHTRRIALDGLAEEGTIAIAVLREQVFVAFGRELHRFGPNDEMSARLLTDSANAMCTTPTKISPWLAIAQARGVEVFHFANNDLRPRGRFATDMEAPLVTFTTHDMLVVATADRIVAYNVGAAVTPAKLHPGPGRPLVAVMPGPRAHEVALLTDDGGVQVQRL